MEEKTNEKGQSIRTQLGFPWTPVRRTFDVVYWKSASAGRRGLVFIPKHMALELAATQRALCLSKTWGEFRSAAPPRVYQEVLDNQLEGGTSFEASTTS